MIRLAFELESHPLLWLRRGGYYQGTRVRELGRERIVKAGEPLLVEDLFKGPSLATTGDFMFEVSQMLDGDNPCPVSPLFKL